MSRECEIMQTSFSSNFHLVVLPSIDDSCFKPLFNGDFLNFIIPYPCVCWHSTLVILILPLFISMNSLFRILFSYNTLSILTFVLKLSPVLSEVSSNVLHHFTCLHCFLSYSLFPATRCFRFTFSLC